MEVPRPVEIPESSTPGRRRDLPGALLLCVILQVGCQTYYRPSQPTFSTSPELPAATVGSTEQSRIAARALVESSPEALAETHLATARQLQREGRDGCVDHYYRAALLAWQSMESASLEGVTSVSDLDAWQVYEESLAGLIDTAQEYRRLDPRGSLTVSSDRGPQVIPVTHHGFAWKPADFHQLLSTEAYQRSTLAHHYRTQGLGTSLIALRQGVPGELYHTPQQPFAVTAVLRPSSSASRSFGTPAPTADSEAILEFYNPHLFASLPVGMRAVPLQRDLTAPFAYVARQSSRGYLEGFFDPGDTDAQPQLLMIEPYQRGKIPVIFIHGLLSDPTTWLDAANELRAQPDLYQQYQFWYYRYPTGGSLLTSAANLREQLLAVRETYDPAGEDPALSRMIVVGHSMGGLMARLQVTYSSDILWRHAARQPLEAVRTTPQYRQRIERHFFFDPSPLVQRVVFIGTPHRGSNMARRLIGRIASSLVRPFGENMPEYQRLMEDNPDIFYEYLHKAPPTSIDLLEPTNPLLDAVASMPFARHVRLHSIIGTGGSILVGEPGDGVVPVSSAHLPGVCSELLVPASHRELHHAPATMAELSRILREHAGSAPQLLIEHRTD